MCGFGSYALPGVSFCSIPSFREPAGSSVDTIVTKGALMRPFLALHLGISGKCVDLDRMQFRSVASPLLAHLNFFGRHECD